MGLEYVDLSEAEVDLSLLDSFPQKLIYRESLFPLRRENGCLIVATSDPFVLYPLDEVSAATGTTVTRVLAGNDAAGAYTRLVDMGVEPFLVSSTVDAVMAQRLVRTLCEGCKEPYKPSGDKLPPDFPLDQLQQSGATLYRTRG